MPKPVDLEPQAKAVVDATAAPPYLFELGPDQGRRTIDELQGTVASGPKVPLAGSKVEPLPVQPAARSPQSNQSWHRR